MGVVECMVQGHQSLTTLDGHTILSAGLDLKCMVWVMAVYILYYTCRYMAVCYIWYGVQPYS